MKQILSVISRETAEKAMSEYNVASAQLDHDVAELQQKINALTFSYQARIDKCRAALDAAKAVLKDFAVQNRDRLFGETKSMPMLGGTFGFRLGGWKLKALKGHRLMMATISALTSMTEYVRHGADSLDRQALIADRDKPGVAERLRQCGLQITQDEDFFINPARNC
jgi:phage host-nuclease inhibitor protein Gam